MRFILQYAGHSLRQLVILLVLSSSLVLTSCGGEVLLALQYIPAIGGNFCHDADTTTDLLDSNGNCKSEEIFIGIESNSSAGVTWEDLYDGKLGIRGSIDGLTSNILSCKNFVGLTDGRKVTAYDNGDNEDLIGTADLIDAAIHTVCFTASFVNMNLLRLSNGEEFLRDDVPLLTEGIWSNIDNSAQILKISTQNDTSFTGCEIVNGVKTILQGNFVRSDISNRVFTDLTDITFMRSTGDEVFQGDFIGISAIKLSGNGQTLEFQREPDDNIECN